MIKCDFMSLKGETLRKNLIPILLIAASLVIISAVAFVRLTDTDSTSETSSVEQSQQSAQTGQQSQGSTQTQTDVEPTVLKDGETIEDHVIAYYDAWKEGRYQDAYELQPAERKAVESVEEFTQLRQQYGNISEYEVAPTVVNDREAQIDVQYDLGDNGVWACRWFFEKNKDDQWVAVSFKAGMRSME